jgi:hypothetical protein
MINIVIIRIIIIKTKIKKQKVKIIIIFSKCGDLNSEDYNFKLELKKYSNYSDGKSIEKSLFNYIKIIE